MTRYPGLAAALAARVAPRAPGGLAVSEQPAGHLQARADEARWEALPVDEPDVEEEIAGDAYDPPYPAFAVLEALDFLQEFARDELGETWAGEAWAELGDGEIRFGFGDAAFEPIPLAAVGG